MALIHARSTVNLKEDGVTYAVDEITTGSVTQDGLVPARALTVGSLSYHNNGTSWEKRRGNVEGTALASAVRNGTTFASPDIVAHNARGVIGFLNVTAVPGTITVNGRFQYKDPISGNYASAPSGGAPGFNDSVSVSTSVTALLVFQLGNHNSAFTMNVPRTFRFLVTHSGAGDFTYSVGYTLMN